MNESTSNTSNLRQNITNLGELTNLFVQGMQLVREAAQDNSLGYLDPATRREIAEFLSSVAGLPDAIFARFGGREGLRSAFLETAAACRQDGLDDLAQGVERDLDKLVSRGVVPGR